MRRLAAYRIQCNTQMSHENNTEKRNVPHGAGDGADGRDSGLMPPTRRNRAPKFEHKKPAKPHDRPSRDGNGSSSDAKRGQANAVAPKTARPGKAGGTEAPSRHGAPKGAPHAAPHGRKRMTNPRELVIDALMRIDSGGFSNIVWDNAVNGSDLSGLDKMLATRIFYGTISNMRLIDAIWTQIEPEMLRRADTVVKMALRSAMYQLVFLDRVPAYSIVSTTVEIVKRMRNRAASGYCNALLRKAVACQESEAGLHYIPTGDAVADFAVRYSMNDDLARLLMREFPEDAETIAQSMLSVPRMVLRVNTSKTTLAAFTSGQIHVEPSRLLPDTSCTVLTRHDAIDAAIDRGDVCVQDEAAQLAVCALGAPESWARPHAEVHIWDACAGQGGKSFHLMDEIASARDASERRYSLLCTDLYANKLERLRDYQQRVFPNVHVLTKARDLAEPGSVPLAPFDAVLVDAPCSGLGVLRRHPEVKLARKAEDIASLVILQREILDNACKHIRVGGILVYAVCTITTEECEDQVADFLRQHPNFRADALPAPCLCGNAPCSERKYLPHIDGCDGFYIARFVRTE